MVWLEGARDIEGRTCLQTRRSPSSDGKRAPASVRGDVEEMFGVVRRCKTKDKKEKKSTWRRWCCKLHLARRGPAGVSAPHAVGVLPEDIRRPVRVHLANFANPTL